MKIIKQKLRPHAQYYSSLQLKNNKNTLGGTIQLQCASLWAPFDNRNMKPQPYKMKFKELSVKENS